ncbi:MAG TPA: hypothetical protein VGQ00_02635 [Candidatus Norongarragalinales archaeon]|jgi:hypothetical protein|nr:hypothetical protein [Candidatus Norongarragalinales archaeon]
MKVFIAAVLFSCLFLAGCVQTQTTVQAGATPSPINLGNLDLAKAGNLGVPDEVVGNISINTSVKANVTLNQSALYPNVTYASPTPYPTYSGYGG